MTTANAFAEFISRKVERLDEDILRSMCPLDADWIRRLSQYDRVLEEVRKLSEGLAYLPTLFGPISVGKFHKEDGVQASFARFKKVFRKLHRYKT